MNVCMKPFLELDSYKKDPHTVCFNTFIVFQQIVKHWSILLLTLFQISQPSTQHSRLGQVPQL